MKKVLLIAGFVISIIILGDILILVTKSGAIANWGSMIIPSFLLGIVAKRLLIDPEFNKFMIIAPIFLVGLKLISMILMGVQPTVFAFILIPSFYYSVSFLLVFLGEKLAESSGKRAT